MTNLSPAFPRSTPSSADTPPTPSDPHRNPARTQRPRVHSADGPRHGGRDDTGRLTGAPPRRPDTPATPEDLHTDVPDAAPPSTDRPRPPLNGNRSASATSSTPTANPPWPARCRSATTAWTCATPSASSWGTATPPAG